MIRLLENTNRGPISLSLTTFPWVCVSAAPGPAVFWPIGAILATLRAFTRIRFYGNACPGPEALAAHVPSEPRVHLGRGDSADSGDRREYGDFLGGELGVAETG